MAEVDNKVVSITFDNASFERKMSETIASLDKLRHSLDMQGAQKGLAEIGEAGKNFNLDTMNTSIEGTSAKFIAMTTVGVQALTALVGGAARAGAQFAKSLAIDPIAQGFGEFELKMGSIQTIMAGSGESLEVVNTKLQELNAYSDKTIYSFGDMTSNIGKFTNAGVKLDDAVGAIQGVANVAALSGANAEEASRAMYNFGQALGQGSVKAIDWKSIELANMGTVEFKQQLIDAAVAMGTLTKAGDGTYKTLEGTTVTTSNFATTLSDAWLSADVLTGTLNKFSDTSTDIGARATKAATQVKTFSQMIDTMKESVGSGWAATFENVIGNFDEGSALFTRINTAFGNVVGASAEARNKLLLDWKNFGARDTLIESLATAGKGLMSILRPIGDAFRDIFPKKTAADLIYLTARFSEFAKRIKIGGETAEKIKVAFRGFFAILGIGWEILKNVVQLFFALVGVVWKVLGPLLGLVGGTGELATGLHAVLVKGQGIDKFFDAIITVLTGFADAAHDVVQGFVDMVVGLDLFGKAASALKTPIDMLKAAAEAIKDFVANLKFGDKAGKGVEETGKAVEKTAGLFDRLLAALKNVFGQIGEFLGGIGKTIAKAFGGLGDAIGKALGTGDFNQVLNVIKTGLLGGILAMLVQFFRKGIKFDFGQGKLLDSLKDVAKSIETTFGQLTSTLKTLQSSVRADMIMKIAIAVGILTIAIVALSLVDAKALAKAMAAITAGFLELTGVMYALEKMSDGGGALKIAAMAGGMVLMAAAMALLAIPIIALSKLDMWSLVKGLGAVVVGMIGMSIAMRVMGESENLVGVFKAAAAMILVSVALIILAKAIKAFAEMNLAEVGFGLAQAALGIGLLIVALKNMPDDVAAKGVGLLILSIALRSLARVVQLFAGIDWKILVKGFGFIAAGIFLIAEAMWSFPEDMEKQSVGMIALSAALWIMAVAVEKMGGLDWQTLVKGVVAFTAVLVVLSAAILLMSEAETGVAGLIAAAAGLWIMAVAVEKMGSLPWDELLKGLLGLAAVLAILALASLVAPGIALLGIALAAVGIGFILFGAGIALAGKGFELMAKYGTKAMGHLGSALQEFIRQLPQFVSAFVEGLIQAAKETADAFPELIKSIEKVLLTLIQAVRNVLPQVQDAVSEFVTAIIDTVTDQIPEIVELGLTIIMSLLQGIRDNIGEVVTTVGEIITEFLDALSEQIPRVVDSVVGFFETVASEAGELMPTFMPRIALAFIDGFLNGIESLMPGVGEFFRGMVTAIIDFVKGAFGIHSPSTVMADIGKNVIQGLIDGVKFLGNALRTIFIEIPGKILGWIGNLLGTLFNKGKDLIGGLLKGIAEKIVDVKNFYVGLGRKIFEWIGNVLTTIKSKGSDLIGGLFNGITEKIVVVKNFYTGLAGSIIGWIGNASTMLKETGKNLIRGLWAGILAMKDWIVDKIKDVGGWVTDGFGKVMEIFSPSRVFARFGVNIGKGLIVGIDSMEKPISKATVGMAGNLTKAWEKTNTELLASVSNIDEFRPIITPVLDLSEVQADAKKLSALATDATIAPVLSFANAQLIASARDNQNGSESEVVPPTSVTNHFEQNIHAPEALSTADIYRQTKSQFALAKEELEIA
jgi:tape measure domain-containing protein